MTALKQVVDNSSKRGFWHVGGAVGKTYNHLTALMLNHSVQDATGDVGAYTVHCGHLYVGSCSHVCCFFQHCLSFLVMNFARFIVKRDGEPYKAIIDVGVTDE